MEHLNDNNLPEDSGTTSPTPPGQTTHGGSQPGPGERLLTVHEVAARLAVSPRQLWRLCASDKFLRPLTLGSRCKRWRAGDVDRYLREMQPSGLGVLPPRNSSESP